MDSALHSALFSLPAMPTEVLAQITSYLTWFSTVELLRASNRSLYLRLHQGGVQAIQLCTGRRKGADWKECAEDAFEPWLVEEVGVKTYASTVLHWKQPPTNPFTSIKSFICDYEITREHVLALPPTLTQFSVRCLAGMNLFDGTLQRHFPDLLHVSVHEESQTPGPASQSLPKLPCGLLSLRTAFPDVSAIFHCASMLPRTLVHLEVMRVPHSKSSILGSIHFTPALPPGLTSLYLPMCELQLPTLVTGELGARLRSLSLRSVQKDCVHLLPRYLTRLTLHETGPRLFQQEQWDAWPSTLQTLVIHNCKGNIDSGGTAREPIPCLPSLTRLKFARNSRLFSGGSRCLPDDKPFVLFQAINECPKLVIFDAPSSTCTEALLGKFPPTLTRVTLFDVTLSGSSLPPTLEYLDAAEDVQKPFWAVPRPFQVVLRAIGAPSVVHRLQQVPTQFLKSLTLPNHGIDDLSSLPQTLTKLSHVSICNSQLELLPKNLTSLHAFQRPTSSGAPLDLERLLKHLPYLLTFTSSLSSDTSARQIELQVLPGQLPPEIQLSATNTPSDPYPHPITLPRDALQSFYRGLPAGVELDGLAYDSATLLSESTKLCLKHLIVEGVLALPQQLVRDGIAVGLETLDLAHGNLMLRIDGGKMRPLVEFPKIPTLKTLLLSGDLALGVLFSGESDPTQFFCRALETLVLVFDSEPPYKWKISGHLPRTLKTLEARLKSKESLDYAETGCLTPLGFTITSRLERPPYHCLVAERGDEPESTSCTVM